MSDIQITSNTIELEEVQIGNAIYVETDVFFHGPQIISLKVVGINGNMIALKCEASKTVKMHDINQIRAMPHWIEKKPKGFFSRFFGNN